MAAVRAVKSGNWSDPTVWSTGTVPTSGDTVYANTFTVTIDQDVLIGDVNNILVNAGSFVAGQYYIITETGDTSFTSIGSTSNDVGTIFLATGPGTGTGIAQTLATITTWNNTDAGATAGGSFNLSSNYNIWANIIASATSDCLNVTGTAITTIKGDIPEEISNRYPSRNGINYSGTGSLTIIGDIYAVRLNGINKTSSGSLTVVGDITSTQSGYNAAGILFTSTSSGNVDITGDIRAGIGNGSYGIRLDTGANANITITGNVYGGRGSNTSRGIINSTSSTITITGNVYGGEGGGGSETGVSGIFTRGNLSITGNIYANIGCGVVSDITSITIQILGSTYDSVLGVRAMYVRKLNNLGIPSQAVRQVSIDGSSTVTYYTVDNNIWDYPQIQDVRDGVSYANNNLTGTCKVPSPNNVTYNVPVDNMVGTAVLKPENVWDYLKSSIDTEGSIGERLKNTVTANDVGKLLIDTLT